MRKLVLASLAVFWVSDAAAEMVYQGSVSFQNGATYEALTIRDSGYSQILNDEEEIVLRLHDGSNVTIDKERIAAIEFVSFGSEIEADDAIVTLKNGNTARLRHVVVGSKFMLHVKDPLTEEARWIEIDATVEGQAIARISFSGIGPLMWSESSEKYFPSSYLYDPFTGDQLIARGRQ